MKQVSAGIFDNNIDSMLRMAEREPLLIVHPEKEPMVLISIEDFKRRVQANI